MSTLETERLGRRYGRRWALRDCTVSIPAGRVVGLVGPNGAGKTTLLHLVVGLLRPSEGTVRVLGGPLAYGRPEQLRRVGFVAQDKPLYRAFRVADMLTFGQAMNPTSWDMAWATTRLSQLGIPTGARIGELSGGQQAQVALAVALGKRPELLVLDEPVANLDPLARREFLQVLMGEAAGRGLSVLMSSHLVADLERVCDYLVLLSGGRVRLAGDVDTLLSAHRSFVGTREQTHAVAHAHSVVNSSFTDRQGTLLLRLQSRLIDRSLAMRPVDLEELVLGYMSAPSDESSGARLACVDEDVSA